ncbi:MAG: ABC transporter permease [Candidatus Dormibacteraceae bacterium]
MSLLSTMQAFARRTQARSLGLLLVLAIWLVYLGFAAPYYFSIDNYKAIGIEMALVGIGAVGTTMLLISANVDLSIGSMYAVCATVAAIEAKRYGVVPGIAIGILLGGVLGLINGALVWRVRISPLIITLGGLTLLRGVTELLTNGYAIIDLPNGFTRLGAPNLFGVQMPIWYMLIAFLLVGIVLRFTTLGRHIYAVGSNQAASRAAGLRVRRIVISVFVVNGLIVGFVGVVAASRFGTANPTFGIGYELDVLTAVILGGVAFTGGEGSLLGVFIALLLITNISNGIVAIGLDPAWANVSKGAILIFAVVLDQVSRERRDRFRRMLAMRERADPITEGVATHRLVDPVASKRGG